MVLPPMLVERDQRLYNMVRCMVKCFTMSSCMLMDIQLAGTELIMTWPCDGRQTHISGVGYFWWLQRFGSHNC
jgi:hypothetical protein